MAHNREPVTALSLSCFISEAHKAYLRAATGSRLCALCASKKKRDRERVGIELEVCASEIEQYKREGRNRFTVHVHVVVCLVRL